MFIFKVDLYQKSKIMNLCLLFFELELDTKWSTHLHIFIIFIKKSQIKNREITDEKNELSNSRKKIESYDKKTFMKIQFILEIYVYRQK